MNQGALIWLIIFVASAIVFFAIAAIVAVKGLKDLFALLDLYAPSPKKPNPNGDISK